MRRNYRGHLALVFVTAVVSTTMARARPWSRRQGQKAQVQFVASSTFFRTTWGFNEDTYLARLQLPKSHGKALVRLIDAYPNGAAPLARTVLQSDSGVTLSVKRDTECDMPFGGIVLRALPGDLLAILPIRLSYTPPLDPTPAREVLLPCYRVLRR